MARLDCFLWYVGDDYYETGGIMYMYVIISLFVSAHCLWNKNVNERARRKTANVPALSSAKRAPTRSECFKNLSAQFDKHWSCHSSQLNRFWRETGRKRTSFDDKALLVKSLQHELKQRSTKLEYILRKSCIYVAMLVMFVESTFPDWPVSFPVS